MAELRNMPAKVFTVALALTPGLEKRFRQESTCLSEKEYTLAGRMGRYDKAHAARMAREVRGDDVLKRAVLLHDVGKTDAHLKFVFRVLYTNLELLAPWLLRRIMAKVEKRAAGSDATDHLESLGPAWMKAFYAQAHHAAVGAVMLGRAGSDAEVIALVGGHQNPLETYGARALRLRDLDSSK